MDVIMENKLQEINHLDAVNASKALLKLGDSEVMVKLDMAKVQRMEEGIKIADEQMGGSQGRLVEFSPTTDIVAVRVILV
jgi:chemotaxis receptor (MCP) glutamine deamidase CheD